jgi:hypothetical protein
MPLMWSGWKCEIRMVSICAGCTPAAASASNMWPVVGPSWPAVPVSIRISFEPVFTSSAVNEVGTMPGCRNESVSALSTSVALAFFTNLSSILRNQVPSYSAVSS